MKKSSALVAALLVGASATGVSALVSPFYGSDFDTDVVFNVTDSVIAACGLGPASAFVGGGSGVAENAMVAKLQSVAPMSRMLGSASCAFNDTTRKGLGDGNASGIVFALGSVDVLASSAQIDTATCNGTADGTQTGLAYSGTTGVFVTGAGAPPQNWKWVLALLYGGLDYSTGVVDCNQFSRIDLVNNWSNLFQNSGTCSNTNGACQALASAGDGTHTPLWHAFRRDDAASASALFASVLGLSPTQSQTAVNGFGASPYCNALNWDVTSDTTGTCVLGNHDQFSGPGGMIDPLSKCTIGASPVCGAAGTGNHRMPPLVPASWNNNNGGVWGLNPNVTKAACNHQLADVTQCIYDVLPTDMQDNDPIRRPCQGVGKSGNKNVQGEEVCNLDGALGLVLAIPSSEFIAQAPPEGLGLAQYPSGTCGSAIFGNAPNVFTCAPGNIVHSGECPNGDSLIGGQCSVPVLQGTGAMGTVGQVCLASKTTVSNFTNRTNLGVAAGLPAGSPDGRVFNLHMRTAAVDGAIVYLRQVLQNVVNGVSTPISRDFVGGMGRIHEFETMVGTAAVGCQMLDANDQMGCLAQADPCSIAYAGDGAKTWNLRTDGTIPPPPSSGIDAARIAQVYPTATTLNLLGQTSEYVFATKMYLNSIAGFGNVATENLLPANAPDPSELCIAEYESQYVNSDVPTFASILAANGYVQVTNGPLGNAPFCEDFNEGINCIGGVNAQNACTTNVNLVLGAGVWGPGGSRVPSEPVGANSLSAPTQSTVCGNGKLEPYEECDNGAANGTAGNACTTICRCSPPTALTAPGTCTGFLPPADVCPFWNAVVANPAALSTGAPGNVGLLTATGSAIGADISQLVYTWSVLSGTGTLSNQSAQGRTTNTINFTCPPSVTPETDVVQVVISAQAGAQCPASDTTASVTLTCTPPPCFGLGGVEATPNTAQGTCPAGLMNDARDALGNFCCTALLPCTASGQTGCVQCQHNAANNGICTPTEALLVQHDINLRVATAPGPDPAAGCYSCLNTNLALDDNIGDTGDECGDPLMTGTSPQCLAAVACVLGTGNGTAGSSCAATATDGCYCGNSSLCETPNGACATQIATALGFPVSDFPDVLANLTDQSRAGGIAMALFRTALTNHCGACLE
jgi:hypothetical protein